MILVTGGTGLVGSHLIYCLLKQGKSARVLVRDKQSPEKLRQQLISLGSVLELNVDELQFVPGDVTDYYSINEALDGIKNVYHCAGMVSFSRTGRKQMLETNIRGTANVVNACLENTVSKLLHVSSIAAVKTPENGNEASETDGWPVSSYLNYAYSKTQSEYEVWRGISEGLNAVIVNPSVILGYGNAETGSSAIFGKIMKGLKYYTKGSTGFVSAMDLALTMIKLMESNIHSERFIISAENLSYQELFTKIAIALDLPPPEKYATPAMTEIAWRYERLKELLFGTNPALTKKTARSAHAQQSYSSEKLKNAIQFEYAPIDTCIADIAGLFKQNNKTSSGEEK